MSAYTTREELSDALNDAGYPASRTDLTDAARRNGAGQQTVRALRAIPAVDYGSFEDVLASVDLVDEETRLAAEQDAQRRRMHTHDRLPEHEKDLPAPTPIVGNGGRTGAADDAPPP